MTEPVGQKVVSETTGRYTITKNTKAGKTTTTYFAKNGTQLKGDYYQAAEAKDLAHQNGYDKYYKTETFQKDGKFYVKVTAKTKQSYGILAEDYLKKVNDGTIKQYNPKAFEGYDCMTDDGRQLSDLNKEMKPGDSVILPADRVEIKGSTVGWFRRNVMNVAY